ncbi:MAG: metal-dependent transcriptional regulator [Ancrocorticia sp.]|jgi:DtxR family Mn-dependent transcriptional regulator|nr:metal-dependent transcriptional regulator [Ancrocorticia sp.]MCI2029538.1 metal-dependent transcriptional regulator [Ancrocorticia sp.]
MSGDLVDTTEMYLKAIYELEEEGEPPLRARLVERLGQSKPTVSETVARLERDGLLWIEGSRTIVLSPKGCKHATRVMRKHRLAERLLLDVLLVPWEAVHDEACRWEHVISDEVEAKIAALLGNVTSDPFGNPIPPDGVCGPGDQSAVAAGLERGHEFIRKHPGGGRARVSRIGEVLQTDPQLLAQLRKTGVIPGAQVQVSSEDQQNWLITGDNGTMEFAPWVQNHLMLRP